MYGKEMNRWASSFVVTSPTGNNPPIQPTNESPLRRTLKSIGFSPLPKPSRPIIHPSFIPKVTKETLSFCKTLLKKISKKKYKSQLASCLQDAPSPFVARSIAKVNSVAAKQQRRAIQNVKKSMKPQRMQYLENRAFYLQKRAEYLRKRARTLHKRAHHLLRVRYQS
jgi:hypothetical protein